MPVLLLLTQNIPEGTLSSQVGRGRALSLGKDPGYHSASASVCESSWVLCMSMFPGQMGRSDATMGV